MAPSGVGRNELLTVTRRSAAVIFSSRSSSKPTNETGPSLAEMDAFRSRTAEPGDIIITSLRLVSTSGSAFAPCTNDRGQIIQWVVSPTVFEEIYSPYEVENPADGETQYGKVTSPRRRCQTTSLTCSALVSSCKVHSRHNVVEAIPFPGGISISSQAGSTGHLRHCAAYLLYHHSTREVMKMHRAGFGWVGRVAELETKT